MYGKSKSAGREKKLKMYTCQHHVQTKYLFLFLSNVLKMKLKILKTLNLSEMATPNLGLRDSDRVGETGADTLSDLRRNEFRVQ